MKRLVALFMTLALLLCSASAFAAHENQAYSWAAALPEDATFMFDYSFMQPVQVAAFELENIGTAKKPSYIPAGVYYKLDIDKTTGSATQVLDEDGNPIPVTFAQMTPQEVAYYGMNDDTVEASIELVDSDRTSHRAGIDTVDPEYENESKGGKMANSTFPNTTPMANAATVKSNTTNYITTAFVAGFLKSELNSEGNSSVYQNVVPVDLTEDGTYVYPIVTKAHTIVGLVWATVADGNLTIDGQLRDQVTCYEDFVLKLFKTNAQLAKKGTEYELGTEISIADELKGASGVFFQIVGKVQYHWSIGASKAYHDGSVYSVYWTLQDYWRYERKWRSYRKAMKDICELVPAE